ncbi:hypothetical protein DPSP01_007540 [Paraphaeosphaeria sporulosa]|uniref:DASH complex subunit DAM1 n=1 Tax=Paraphaeosphaeria sporulosa TaxID=1460663 RepID=A0A177C4Z1_9PLEO|nr:uncharacterized protein CC84DRAFT_898693 [Paraphaeosphaeria sporulosa]OAG02585.1 hypothetical protein CC84DRAFT_898693 [Paraphaeosphaeria sporulosa]
MASTTPLAEPRSTSRTPRPRSKSPGSRLSRPTTPLRPSSRSSFRSSVSRGRAPYTSSTNPLEDLQDGFAELSDAMADLEQNFVHLQLMHESLARFSESFASFLYGLNMNAFCVDFPEAPIPDSFKRPLHDPQTNFRTSQNQEVPDVEATFLTTDTSFVENPPSSKVANKFQNPITPAPAEKKAATRGRGGIPRAGARGGGIPVRGGAGRGTRGSGIARGRGAGRGTRGA